MTETGQKEGETIVNEKRVEVAIKAFKNFLGLQSKEGILLMGLRPQEGILLIRDKETTNEETLQILQTAGAQLGVDCKTLDFSEQTPGVEKLDQLYKEHKVIINLSGPGKLRRMMGNLYDTGFLKKHGLRLWSVLDAPPEIFEPGNLMDEELADIKERLGRMEAILNQAVGFRITTSYGTNLIVELQPFHTRRWVGIAGIVDKPGIWDNPGAEVFTTPDEIKIDGVLKLAVLDSEIDPAQGVDEWVELVFYHGVVREIKGGESARKLREKLAEDAKYEESKERDPLNVYRIAEIGFGASKGIPLVTDIGKDYIFPGIATVLTEKCFGSIHLALGGSDHGEEGAEGHFTKVSTHYDFVIPGSGGLTVEMFTNEDDFRKLKNGRPIISSGGMPEW